MGVRAQLKMEVIRMEVEHDQSEAEGIWSDVEGVWMEAKGVWAEAKGIQTEAERSQMGQRTYGRTRMSGHSRRHPFQDTMKLVWAWMSTLG